MWVIWKQMAGWKMLVPIAWFNLETDARDYAKFLSTTGVRNSVIFSPDQHLDGDDVCPPLDDLVW